MLQANLDKLNANLIKLLQDWTETTFPHLEETVKHDMAVYIGNLGNLIQQFPLGNRAINLELSIAAHNIAATVFTRDALLQA
ncbi:hypothetical protein THII_0283 [Thioploca ingrica]|uniref:Uncharacterized protein n=1 Tax=Thioploca ingrica TaxID=40754 RepID=A0A090AID9_9GAMM|nr:hypothetical protein THII_0283 [Thioploca ingrica]